LFDFAVLNPAFIAVFGAENLKELYNDQNAEVADEFYVRRGRSMNK
jgi:hypothetical protein